MAAKRRKPVPKTTNAEQLLLLMLKVIARGPCHEAVCRWDNPCGSCFAGQQFAWMTEWPQFRKFREGWRLVRKKKKK